MVTTPADWWIYLTRHQCRSVQHGRMFARGQNKHVCIFETIVLVERCGLIEVIMLKSDANAGGITPLAKTSTTAHMFINASVQYRRCGKTRRHHSFASVCERLFNRDLSRGNYVQCFCIERIAYPVVFFCQGDRASDPRVLASHV